MMNRLNGFSQPNAYQPNPQDQNPPTNLVPPAAPRLGPTAPPQTPALLWGSGFPMLPPRQHPGDGQG